MDIRTWMVRLMGKWWESMGFSWQVIPLVGAIMTLGSFITAFSVAEPNTVGRAAYLAIGSVSAFIAVLALFPFAAYLLYRELYDDTEPLVTLREAQEREHADYLRLAWEYFDFSVRDSQSDVYTVGFQLDSGFVDEKSITKLLVKTALGGNKETDTDGVSDEERFEWPRVFTVLAARRTQLTTQRIPIRGEGFRKKVDVARKTGNTTARLEVEVHVDGIDDPILLKTRNIPVVISK